MIQRLVLDAHGVVLNNPWTAVLSRLADETHQDRAVVHRRWHADVRTPFWTGQIDPDAMWNQLANGRRLPPGWSKTVEDHYRPGAAAARLPQWSQAVPIWVLSNHHAPWLFARLDRFGLRRYIERIVVSDQLGVAKPDAAAFRPVIDRGLHVGFVDDNPRNVATAAALGCTPVRATHQRRWVRQIDRLVAPHTVEAGTGG